MDDTTHGSIPSKPKGSWIKENPALVTLAVLGAVLAAALVILLINLLLSGDEKGGSRSASAPPPLAPSPPPVSTPASASVPGADNDQPSADSASEDGKDAKEPDEPEEKSEPDEQTEPKEETESKEEEARQRPEDIADWIKEDYFSARAQHDRRLLEAVEDLGERFAGTPKAPPAARMLANLLKPPEVKEDQGDEPKPGTGFRTAAQQDESKLIEAIVAGLHANGSEDARRIFKELLAGNLPTDDDDVTVDATLKTLIEHPSLEYDVILFHALTAAEEFRPQADTTLGRDAQATVTAEELRQKTLALVKSSGSERLRTELAKHLVKPTTPGPWRKTLGGFLEEDRLDNLGAQLVLYASAETPKETKAKLEKYFTAYSSEAMGKILGVSTAEVGAPGRSYPQPPAASSPGRAEVAPDPDRPARIARQLWAAESVAMIAGRLGELESLEKQGQLVALAATIPVDSIRSALLKEFRKHWVGGPQALVAAGLPQRLVSDPGLLLLVKTLLRKPPAGHFSTRDARVQVLKTKEEWTKFSDDLVRAWCERFRTTAQTPGGADQPGRRALGEAQPAAAMPITLPPDTKPAARYHLRWPPISLNQDRQTQLAAVASCPMEIHYVRIEQKARLRTTVGYYKRESGARTRDVRHLVKTEWIETLRILPVNGRKRSVDVLVTSLKEDKPQKVQGGRPRPASAEAEDLVIEILSIEINDPEKSGT